MNKKILFASFFVFFHQSNLHAIEPLSTSLFVASIVGTFAGQKWHKDQETQKQVRNEALNRELMQTEELTQKRTKKMIADQKRAQDRQNYQNSLNPASLEKALENLNTKPELLKRYAKTTDDMATTPLKTDFLYTIHDAASYTKNSHHQALKRKYLKKNNTLTPKTDETAHAQTTDDLQRTTLRADFSEEINKEFRLKLKQKNSVLETQIARVHETAEDHRHKLDAAEQRIEDQQGTIFYINNEISRLQRDKSDLTQQITLSEEQLQRASDENVNLASQIQNLNNQLSEIEQTEKRLLQWMQDPTYTLFSRTAPPKFKELQNVCASALQLAKGQSAGVIFEKTFSPNLKDKASAINPSIPIVIYYVPGTWSNAHKYLSQRQNASDFSENIEIQETDFVVHKDMLALEKFAQQLAQSEQTAVSIRLMYWNGRLSKNDRQEAGIALTADIHDMRKTLENVRIITLSHSHGGNVVHNAAQHAAAENKHQEQPLIDNAIFFGTPVLEKNPLKLGKYNIKTVYNIYSCGDGIGTVGSALLTAWDGNFSATLLKARSLFSDERIVNIGLKKNGQDLHHGAVKSAGLEYLADILHKTNSTFILHSDVMCNIETEEITLENSEENPVVQMSIGRHDPLHSLYSHMISPGLKLYLQQAHEESKISEAIFTEKYNASLHDYSDAPKIIVTEATRKIAPVVNRVTNIFSHIYEFFTRAKQAEQTPQDDLSKSCEYPSETESNLANSSMTNSWMQLGTNSSDIDSSLSSVQQMPTLENLESIIEDKVKQLETTSSFEERRGIMASLYGLLTQFADINDQITAREILQNHANLSKIAQQDQGKQNYIECLKGTTRTDIRRIESLQKNATHRLPKADQMVKQFDAATNIVANAGNFRDLKTSLNGFENLCPEVRELTIIAIKEKMNVPHTDNFIEKVATEYLDSIQSEEKKGGSPLPRIHEYDDQHSS